MKFLIAMDSFKGSLDAVAACRAVVRGVEAVCPTACCDIAPMADGGEGTLDALLASVGGRRCSAMVHDPLMRPVRAEYGLRRISAVYGEPRVHGDSLVCETPEMRIVRQRPSSGVSPW